MGPLTFAVDGVLFDSDGVLVDSLEEAAVVWDAWAARYAPDFDFRTQVEHGVRAADLVARLVGPDRREIALAELNAAEVAAAAVTRPIAGAVELTASLDDARWAVVTSAIGDLARARLSAAGHAVPAVLVTAEDISRGKPHPEPYLRGAERLGVAIGRCAVIEDAPAGVASARAAGAAVVIGVGDHLEGAQVDAHVDDLRAVSWDGRMLRVDPRR